MNSPKTDRRKRYTQMVLKDSLISLMKDKPISKITIKELCELADINRCTFYAHYTDQYDLLQHIENEIIDEVNEALTNYNYKDDTTEAFQMMNKIFEYIADNSSVCSILLSEKGDIDFQKKIMIIAQRQHVMDWTVKKNIDAETAEYIYLFVVNGSIGIVQSWLKNGMNKSTEEMSEMVLKLTGQSLADYFTDKEMSK